MSSRYEDLDEDTRRTLKSYGFDEDEFLRLRSRVRDGSLSPASNPVRGRVEPAQPEDIERLSEPGDPDYDETRAAGLEVLQAGAAASVILNGGMASSSSSWRRPRNSPARSASPFRPR